MASDPPDTIVSMELSPFEVRLVQWAAAASRDWGYPEASESFLDGVRIRLPDGLMDALELGIQQGSVILTDEHHFTLQGLVVGKGPYAWFSKSERQVPAPNWEYFVQAATFARLHKTLAPKGYSLVFEDDLMDIAVYKDQRLVVCCEVKEMASQLGPLLAAIRGYETGFDHIASDRGNDGLRKAKYIVKNQPRYFSLVAIGQVMEFSVEFDGDQAFKLVQDVIPIW